MSGYERMISYLYRYDKGVKGTNAGYAKIELRGDRCRVSLQLRDSLEMLPQMKFFIQKEEGTKTIDAGRIKFGGNGFYIRVETDRTRVMNTSYAFSEVDGIIIPVSPELFYATTWKQIVIHSPLMDSLGEAGQEPPMAMREDEEAADGEPPEAMKEDEETADGEPPEALRENEEAADGEPPGAIRGNEERADEGKPGAMKEDSVTSRIFQIFPQMYPFEIENIQDCVRLDLKDMGYLPVRYWSLAGNPFLLQGYYNYRHLIFIRDNMGKCAMGVPGIYSRQNRAKASQCGFVQFQTLAPVQERQGAFGYWLYFIL